MSASSSRLGASLSGRILMALLAALGLLGACCCPCPAPCEVAAAPPVLQAAPADGRPAPAGVPGPTRQELRDALESAPLAKRGPKTVTKTVRKRPPSLASATDREIVNTLRTEQKVVYGTDDRRPIEAVTDAAVRQRADGVVALFEGGSVTANGDDTVTLTTEVFRTRYSLCEEEPFGDQRVGAFCSGFLVAADVVATAGHCLQDDAAAQATRFVFGFRQVGATTTTRVPASEVYRGLRLLGRVEQASGADWALVKLDRVVTGHPVLPVRRSGRIPDATAVYVIGHPCGLPTVFAGGAAVRSNTPSPYFVANLDTYGGNSGSPVFNAVTHEVEGILVRGETDFVWQGSCRRSLLCPTTGCRGEDCTRVTEFTHLLP